MNQKILLHFGGVMLIIFLLISGIQPYDRLTWLMEVLPVIIALPLLWLTRNRYPLTALLYVWIGIHACVLILGGTYTYARVPLGFALQDWLMLERNPYDKVGHFMQGLVPTLLAREILIKGEYVNNRAMLSFLVLCVALAVSATYELIEWAAAELVADGAIEFLGTQGDPWDAQSDMLFALIGAVVGLLIFSGWHDQQIQRQRDRY